MTIRTGRADVRHDTPAHTPGIMKGHEPGAYGRQAGHLPDGRSDARRSTGIDAKARDPIDPRMPNLSPA